MMDLSLIIILSMLKKSITMQKKFNMFLEVAEVKIVHYISKLCICARNERTSQILWIRYV